MSNASKLSSNFTLYTNNRLSTVTFSQNDIGKIIQNLNPNKVHGHDNISIRMLKIYGSYLNTGLFLSNWKKGTLFLCTNKVIYKNYRPVSLLPICGKTFEKLIFNELFNSLLENNLILPSQSGFKPEDSCINQLLSITHEIYSSFDDGLENRSVLLDVSKAFDKVWHKVFFSNYRKMVYLVTS